MGEVSLETIAVVLCLETRSTGLCGANRFLLLALPQPRLRFFAVTQSIGQTNHSGATCSSMYLADISTHCGPGGTLWLTPCPQEAWHLLQQ